jgi:YVTN family beta-propeller protein
MSSRVCTKYGIILVILAFLLLPGRATRAQSALEVYAPNFGSDTVSVISASTNTVVATIPVGEGPRRIAVTPNGSKAYVTNSASNDVSVINTSSHTVIATIPVGISPAGLAVSPDGAKVYVAVPGAIWIIDTTTDTVATTFAVVGGLPGSPFEPAFTPDGTQVWMSGSCINCIVIFSYPGNTFIGTVGGVIGNAERIRFLPDGSAAFVSNGCGSCGNLQKISTSTNAVVANYSFGGGIGNSLAIAPDGSTVYAGTQAGNQVLRFDPASVSVTGSLPTGDPPEGLAITPDGSTLYVAVAGAANQVLVVDRPSLTVITTIAVGTNPGDLAIVLPPLTPYNFSGFFTPVDNPGAGPAFTFNRVKAGSAIPVKFSLSGDQGLNIFAAGYPKSEKVACATAGSLDDIESTVTAGGSSLSYNATSDQYTYVWKTDKGWATSCRKLTMRLTDNTDHVAYFNFAK